jgi:phosphoribosylglycinamide formyltransferase-1
MSSILGVLASGRGTDLQSIIDHIRLGVLRDVDIGIIISNNPDAYALERAKKHGIEARYIDHRKKEKSVFEGEVLDALKEAGVRLVVLAGWMRILTPHFVKNYSQRMMNIHPALLPLFGGKGMYGERVHKAVLASGMKVSGCTVHYVTEEVDAGPIILQTSVRVKEEDTYETLAERVLVYEHRIYSKAIQLHVDGRTRLERVKVDIGGGRIMEGTVVRIDYGGGWEEEWARRQRIYLEFQKKAWEEMGKSLEAIL